MKPHVMITVTAKTVTFNSVDSANVDNKIVAIIRKTTEKYKFQHMTKRLTKEMTSQLQDTFSCCSWANVNVEISCPSYFYDAN